MSQHKHKAENSEEERAERPDVVTFKIPCLYFCFCFDLKVTKQSNAFYVLFFQYISKSVPTTECVISHGAEGAGNYAGSRMSTRSHHSTTASHASRYTHCSQDGHIIQAKEQVS